MPGSWDTYALGYREKVFVTKEVTYGTPVHPAATDAFLIIGGTFEFTQERANRADKTSSRSYRERLTHRKTANWSVNAYLLPSGTNGVACDVKDILEYGIGASGVKTVNSNTTSASVACTTTELNMVAGKGADYAAGDAISWANAAGDYEVSFVKSIVTDAVTISPAFTAAPGKGDTIKGSVTYKLKDAIGSLAFTRVLDNIVSVFPGCVVGTLQLDFPGDGEGLITVSGPAKLAYTSGCSILSAGIDDTVTAVPVTTGEGIRFQPNTIIRIDDEAMLVTSVVTDTLNVTRAQSGTSKASHTKDAVIGPYELAATVTGYPVSGTIGEMIITGALSARTAIPVTSTQLTLNNNAAVRNNQYGTDSATGYSLTQRRDVTFSTTMWLTKELMSFYGKARVFTAQEVTIQLGKSTGYIVAAQLPQAEFNIPAINGGGAEEVMVPLSGVGLASAADNDEFILAFL